MPRMTTAPQEGVMSQVEQIAEFAHGARFEALGSDTRQQLKIRILDSLGCSLRALHAEPICMIRSYISELGGSGSCTLIGGGSTDVDRAALYNSALIRYLDFNDSYLAKGETCHPSDNLGAILATGEWIGTTGRDLMTALAVAYQVQCRLSDVAPVRARGFDHTVQGAYGVAAGVSKILVLLCYKKGDPQKGQLSGCPFCGSPPMFVAIDSGSVGYQIGGSSTDLVMLFMNDHALQSLLSDKFKLGADASVAAGPVGRNASAGTDLKLHAEVLSYSRAKGVFAGVSLDGAVVQADKSGDEAMYGHDVNRHEILDGKIAVPASAQPLLHEIGEYVREAKAKS